MKVQFALRSHAACVCVCDRVVEWWLRSQSRGRRGGARQASLSRRFLRRVRVLGRCRRDRRLRRDSHACLTRKVCGRVGSRRDELPSSTSPSTNARHARKHWGRRPRPPRMSSSAADTRSPGCASPSRSAPVPFGSPRPPLLVLLARLLARPMPPLARNSPSVAK